MTNTETRNGASEGATSPKESKTNWLAIAAAVASFTTATLVLLGYGVSLAAETLFGIPHAAVFDSTFELMDLASVAILELIPALTDSLGQLAFYTSLYKTRGIIIGLCAAGWLVVAVVGYFWMPKTSNEIKPNRAKKTERLY